PRFRKRSLGRGLTRNSGATLRERAVVMIGKNVDAGPGCHEQIARADEPGARWRGCRLAGRTGTEDDHIRFARLDEGHKGLEVPPVSSRDVDVRCATHLG